MRNRILEIAESPARLRIEHRQLVIQSGGFSSTVPLEDIAVLVISHPQVSYTQSVLSELTAQGGAFLTCDNRHMPCGLLLPLDGNATQTERFQRQFALPAPRRKQLWRQVVRAKISMQAALLRERVGDDAGLTKLLPTVRSGDTRNVEGQAARRYWTALFGNDFRRDRAADDHNRLLNYGYAVLRATVSRAIVASGLHPTVGLHHHNRYNSFCLADDLMEPYRPVVDREVARIVDGADTVPEPTQFVRADLLRAITSSILMDGQRRTLFDAVARTASSLVQCICEDGRDLALPLEFADAVE